jgi:hypothetical protein
MKFIKHISAPLNTKTLYRNGGETIQGDNETVEIQGEAARAELEALQAEHGQFLELRSNLSRTLAGKNALLQELVADLQEQGLNPNVILQTNLNFEGNTIRFGAPGEVRDPLADIRPKARPAGLVPEPAVVEPTVETPVEEEPEAVTPEEPVEETPAEAEVAVEAPVEETIESFETQEVIVKSGDNFYKILRNMGFDGNQQELIVAELGEQGAKPDLIFPDDVIKLEQSDNGTFNVTISRRDEARNFSIAAVRVQPVVEEAPERVAFSLE